MSVGMIFTVLSNSAILVKGSQHGRKATATEQME